MIKPKKNNRVTGQKNRKVITQYNKDGVYLFQWPSIRTLCKTLNIDRRTMQRHLNKEEGYKSIKSFRFNVKRTNN